MMSCTELYTCNVQLHFWCFVGFILSWGLIPRFTLPLGAVPARHRLSKIVRVNATKAVPCRARVSGAVPVLTRFLKRAGSALARHQLCGSVNAKQRWSRAVLCSSMRIIVSTTTCVHHWSAEARVNHKMASKTEKQISYDAHGSQQDDV